MFRRRPLARMAVRTTLIAGTAAVVGGTIASKQAAAAAPEPAPAPEAAPLPAPVAAVAPAPAEPDLIEQLTQLAALKTAGVLTEEEFDTQKARLLA